MIRCYVNTYNRVDLAEQTMRSLLEHRTRYFPITVIDDGSTVDMEPVFGLAASSVVIEHRGEALARKYAIEEFCRSASPDDTGLFLDSDVQFFNGFDAWTLDVLQRSDVLAASPYRSKTHMASDRVLCEGSVVGRTAGGLSLAFKPDVAQFVLFRWKDNWNSDGYDWHLSEAVGQFAKPVSSLLEHTGVKTAGSVHAWNEDSAYFTPASLSTAP